MDRKEARRTARACQIALASAIQAVKDAGLPDTMPEPERAGVLFGSVVAGADKLEEGVQTLRTPGHAKVNPFMLPTGIPNIPAFMIALQFQCLGHNNTISTACATGTQAIGEAAEVIRRGAADIVITGGTESWSPTGRLPVSRRCAPCRSITTIDPKKPRAPSTSNREGFVFSEGAAALVLESLEHAQARGARIYAEVAGHASSADAYHIAAPDPSGLGPIRAMRWALQDAGLSPDAVDYINAHGTSTPINDVTETKAIKNVFGEHAYQLAVSSTKSMIGHPMGAAGALEALACILAICTGLPPPDDQL